MRGAPACFGEEGMGKVEGILNLLDEEEMRRLHAAALTVLEDVGVRLDHEEAAELLRARGCELREGGVVRFPRGLVQSTVDRMVRDYSLEARSGLKMPVRYTQVYFHTVPSAIHRNFSLNTGGFNPHMIDLDGNFRPSEMKDVRDSLRLADALPNITFTGLPCIANEVPPEERPVRMAAELVKHTRKIGGIEAWTALDVEYITRIAHTLAGGEEEFRKHPFLVGYAETRSPLCFDRNMVDVYIHYLRRGVPQSVDTMPAGGTTAPATSAGTMAVGLAETLSALVLGYAVDENACVSIDLCPTLNDMRTMFFPYAGADRLPLLAATVQMLTQFYKRPGGVHGGKTDACSPGVQAGVEKALSMLFPVLFGAVGVGTCGQLAGGVYSHLQLVIDDEIAGYVRRMLDGFDVTDETLALDVIREVGPGGNFLTHPHTARSFKKEFFLTDVFERMSYQTWRTREVRGMEEHCREKARRILAGHDSRALHRGEEKVVDEIVGEAVARIRESK